MSAVDSAVSSISAASTNSVEQNASNDNRQHYHNTQQSNKLRGELAREENDDIVYLGGPRIYSCIHCRTHLTTHDDVISKSFHGKQGRALLIDQCVNVLLGRGEDRLLMTGMHKVADLKCKRCENVIGWTYLKAYERSQKYKEGKYIIEKINLYEETNTSSHWTPS